MPKAKLARSTYLEVASTIGAAIAADAIWHHDRCSWVGAMPEEAPTGGVTMTYQALGADVYGGTAGVGLFLAELAAATEDAEARRTALGALRHAASRAYSLPAESRAGLYAGENGVALALAYASTVLDEEELEHAARAILSAQRVSGEDGEFDLISGHAGAIVALLALRRLLDENELLERAVGHGDNLVAAAEAQQDGLGWHSPTPLGPRPLVGFSHGTAGVATALLELAAASGDRRYWDAAAGALTYERTLYDANARNWPDLRETSPQFAGTRRTFTSFWCHGAPGIALSRLRAVELGESSAREEAVIALETTLEWIANALRAGLNYSLCHGLAGNAEIVGESQELLGERASRAVNEVAAAGIEAHHLSGRAWPSGAHGGQTPSLFLGDAGIGRFYLRLTESQLPSVLLIRPGAFGQI